MFFINNFAFISFENQSKLELRATKRVSQESGGGSGDGEEKKCYVSLEESSAYFLSAMNYKNIWQGFFFR